jgi:AraC family transcriptional regulator
MSTILVSTPRIAVRVCRYAAGERHKRHTDPFSRISYLVQGAFTEDVRCGTALMGPGEVLVKSSAAKHENQFGPRGAVLVALEFLEDDPIADRGTDFWRKRVDAGAMRLAAAFVEAGIAGDAVGAEIAGFDLVAAHEESTERSAPGWLRHLSNDLADAGLAEINVAERARYAGVHPVHASRLFRRCYGASITEYAQAHSVRRAVAHLVGEAPLSEIALNAGFYDQAHMNRVFRRVLGRTPAAHRSLMRQAAC